MAKKMKRSTTEDESSPGSSAASSSEDISREEAARRKRRRSQARRNTSKKKRSYSQGKEIIKFLEEVKQEVCKQSKQVAESKEEMSKQLAKLREEMCKQSKQVAENKEEMYNQLEKLREEMCKQSNHAESKEEICKQMEKDNEEMRKQITEFLTDLRKQWDLHTNGSSGDDSEAPRSQSNQVQPPRYRLVFKSGAIDKIDKGQPFDISVALVDGNDQPVENGPLASATVELVVVKAEFNQHNNQYNWSREDFEGNIKKAQQANSASVDVDQSLKSIVSYGQFNLVQGVKRHSGSKIFRNSGNKKVRLGVMVVSPTEERVLEGLSNPFYVRGHDRLRHNNRSNMQRQSLVDDGYEEQNGAMPNSQNPSWENSTQYEETRLNITGEPPQFPIIGNTNMVSPGLNISGGQLPQLPFLGNTTMLSEEPSTNQNQEALIQQYQVPHLPMWAQATNNQTDELSAPMVGNSRNPNSMSNNYVPLPASEGLPGRGGDTTDIELPPGFRFHPADKELILDYLLRRATGARFMLSIMAEVDIYKIEPWDLPSRAKLGEFEWYFLHRREHESYATGTCPNRTTEFGYWKETGTDKPITVSASATLVTVGFKKALVFYKGQPPMGEKTNWIMHEYRLHDNLLSANEPASSTSSTSGEWLLYRVYHKKSGWKLTPSQDRLLQQLRPQDDNLSNSFLTPAAPSTMPSTSPSIFDCITHLTPTLSTPEPPSSPWSLLW